MFTTRALFVVACAGLLAACSSQPSGPTATIAKVSDVKSSFGPEFTVTDVPTTGIDPKVLAGQKLPDGLKFDPADCATFAAGQAMPADLKGNMAAVSAEGAGTRFITIAMETSEPIPVADPGANCQKVGFTGGAMRGAVEVVPAPQIPDVQTQGVHRILQTTINGKPQIGEIYSYLAHFGDYQVIVSANPLVDGDKPVVPVDTKRAEALLTAAVAAIKS
ncbi:DUF5642 family protein [soil metagenome]